MSLFFFYPQKTEWAKSGQHSFDNLLKPLKVVIKKSGHLCKNIIANFTQLNKMNLTSFYIFNTENKTLKKLSDIFDMVVLSNNFEMST